MRVRGEFVLRKNDRCAAETVGLDDVRAGFQVFPVNVQDHLGARANEILVASFERRAAKIRRTQVALLQHGAHGAVKHQDSLREQLS